MKITKVSYSALLNLGNYSNEKIGFVAEITEEDNISDVINKLKEKVKENGGVNADELYQTQARGKNQLRELEQKINAARQEWEATAEFLKAQGIRADAPSMPKFNRLLPEVKLEESGTVDGELVGEDDEQTF